MLLVSYIILVNEGVPSSSYRIAHDFQVWTCCLSHTSHLPKKKFHPSPIALFLAFRSFSRVWAIGDCILRARRSKENPLQALIAREDAKVLVTGKIRDVKLETSGGLIAAVYTLKAWPTVLQGQGRSTPKKWRSCCAWCWISRTRTWWRGEWMR